METTEREHAAMEAAGMTDDELDEIIIHDPNAPHALVKACWDEREIRNQARFSNSIENKH